jgi:hypothetical protein
VTMVMEGITLAAGQLAISSELPLG